MAIELGTSQEVSGKCQQSVNLHKTCWLPETQQTIKFWNGEFDYTVKKDERVRETNN